MRQPDDISAGTSLATADWDSVAQKALRLWLAWHEAYETATAKLCALGPSEYQGLERVLDQLDELRAEAVRLSRHAVD